MMERQIAELDFLAGDLESMDEFNETYECLLNECKATGDKETARRMQRILFQQFMFLFAEWRKEEAVMEKGEIGKT